MDGEQVCQNLYSIEERVSKPAVIFWQPCSSLTQGPTCKPTSLIFETKLFIPKAVCIVIKITIFLLKLSLIKNTAFGIN